MIRMAGSRMIYGNISKVVTEEISQAPMLKYLLGKPKHWNEAIIRYIDCTVMGAYLKKLKGRKVTNVLKLFYGWQNYGQQKELFDEDCEDYERPVGFGMVETRMHFIMCKVPHLKDIHKIRCTDFR